MRRLVLLIPAFLLLLGGILAFSLWPSPVEATAVTPASGRTLSAFRSEAELRTFLQQRRRQMGRGMSDGIVVTGTAIPAPAPVAKAAF